MRLSVLGASHYSQAVSAAEPPRSLDAELLPLCRERYRRVDRFVQLALLGSARAAQGLTLSPRCGLYLHSGIGPVGNNTEVQQQLFRDRQLPKPFQFVNTLGSSSLYFTSKNLGLNAQAWFLSRRRAGLLAALELAVQDLGQGRLDQALCGAVEECPLPVEAQCARVGLPQGTPLAESSDWLLLAPGQGSGPGLELSYHADLAALRQAAGPGARVWPGLSLSPEQAAALGPERLAPGPWHDSLDASALAVFFSQKKSGSLYLAAAAGQKGFALLHGFS